MLKAIKVELRRRMHDPTSEVGARLRKVVIGYYQDHVVSGNLRQLSTFRQGISRLWYQQSTRPQEGGSLGHRHPDVEQHESYNPENPVI